MTRARALVAVAVLGTSLLVSVASAAPASAAIAVTVDPSTDLADGQAVTVTGTGFTPNASVGTAECSPAVAQSRATADCDLSTSRVSNTDANGSVKLVI